MTLSDDDVAESARIIDTGPCGARAQVALAPDAAG
jgi:hypothetical protein